MSNNDLTKDPWGNQENHVMHLQRKWRQAEDKASAQRIRADCMAMERDELAIQLEKVK